MKNTENQTIAFFITKTKTFTKVYIRSKGLYGSNATAKILFVRPLYVISRHFCPNHYFIFRNITRKTCLKDIFLSTPLNAP